MLHIPEKFKKTVPPIRFQRLSLLLLFVLFISSCERLEIKRITKVSTGSVSDKTATSARVQGEIIEQGEGGIKKHGHCWSLTQNPTINNDKTDLGAVTTPGSFNSELAALSPGTTYYVRAYATDNDGTSYGNEVNFITLNTPVPDAPTDLYAHAVSGSEIYLSWTDNSNNEAGFKIERAGESMAFREIAIVGTDTSYFMNAGLTAAVTYHYRVRAYNDGGNSDYSNTADATTCISSPSTITTEPTGIDTNRATFNGVVNPNNYLTDVAFEWGITPDLGNYISAVQSPISGSNGINVSAEVTTLVPNTRFYYCVIATGCGATVFGDTLFFDTPSDVVYDANDNVYHVVHIGTQVWLRENLIATTPVDASGDVPEVRDPSDWASLTTPGYCWYNNDARYKSIYGALYNWYAVGWRRLCPVDWHVPSNDEWDLLISFLGGTTVAGGKMKITGTDFWDAPNSGATNESGFTALPGGWREWTDGTYMSIRGTGYWWSSISSTETEAWGYHAYNWNAEINGNVLVKTNGFSIRCIRNY